MIEKKQIYSQMCIPQNSEAQFGFLFHFFPPWSHTYVIIKSTPFQGINPARNPGAYGDCRGELRRSDPTDQPREPRPGINPFYLLFCRRHPGLGGDGFHLPTGHPGRDDTQRSRPNGEKEVATSLLSDPSCRTSGFFGGSSGTLLEFSPDCLDLIFGGVLSSAPGC